MTNLASTYDHLMSNVLEAAVEYCAAEQVLSEAYSTGNWEKEANTAKRKAAEMAVAIDGLSDRTSLHLGIKIEKVRLAVSALCFWPGSDIVRKEAYERMYSVANAYKHSHLTKSTHVITSFEDVLVVGLGYGLDGSGVGKFGGVEVLVRDRQGESWKMLGDAPVVIGAWFQYLQNLLYPLPSNVISVCGVQVHPR